MSKKRTLDSFFSKAPAPKREKVDEEGLATTPNQNSTIKEENDIPKKYTNHATYPWPVPHFPPAIEDQLGFCPATEPHFINDKPDLDLAYYEPYVSKEIQRAVFTFLRENLFFYRVRYTIKRGGIDTQINTPRFTTVFGVDDTSFWTETTPNTNDNDNQPNTTTTTEFVLTDRHPKPVQKYKCTPRPIPHCLDTLRKLTEASTGEQFNFCLVNYYASGADSISYHSDDERFLGKEPCIASFSFGARRDFLMRHKPVPPKDGGEQLPKDLEEAISKPLKLPLGSGDMVLMRGATQANWLHSIPKRKGGESDRGRINITFRRALVRGGTENYYQYNVGDGEVYRWDEMGQEMGPWTAPATKEEV